MPAAQSCLKCGAELSGYIADGLCPQCSQFPGAFGAAGQESTTSNLVVPADEQTLIGTSLNQYQIVSFLGAGGMGKVYRAQDTKLRREVAVKILPKELAGDAARLRRFEME